MAKLFKTKKPATPAPTAKTEASTSAEASGAREAADQSGATHWPLEIGKPKPLCPENYPEKFDIFGNPL